jgi:RNA-directed DNA polymerase
MMHGREKSDLAVVAAKQANKAGQPAAESVERRVGAEGTAVQQRTFRTLCRVSV